ncbi:MAG: hypothetical protein HKN24_04170 [Acidimicrobiales bacterium]|nr:hypothetical protein [Acidimicrobiales bacterium]
MTGIQQERASEATISQLPRRGLVPGFFLAIMILGPGLTSPEFSVLWLLRLFTVVLVVMRITQIRLAVDHEAVVVTNFFRTQRIPLADVRVPVDQPAPGFLQLETSSGIVHVGAAPSWGTDLTNIGVRLVDEIERRRGSR